jgi:hypothetical protein
LSNIELIERTLTLDRQNPRVHFLAAKGHCFQKQKAQAFHHITKAIARAQYEKNGYCEIHSLTKAYKIFTLSKTCLRFISVSPIFVSCDNESCIPS